jgi:hypothetical protein
MSTRSRIRLKKVKEHVSSKSRGQGQGKTELRRSQLVPGLDSGHPWSPSPGSRQRHSLLAFKRDLALDSLGLSDRFGKREVIHNTYIT